MFPNIFSHRPPLPNPFRIDWNAQKQSEFTELHTGRRFTRVECAGPIFVVGGTIGSKWWQIRWVDIDTSVAWKWVFLGQPWPNTRELDISVEFLGGLIPLSPQSIISFANINKHISCFSSFAGFAFFQTNGKGNFRLFKQELRRDSFA